MRDASYIRSLRSSDILSSLKLVQSYILSYSITNWLIIECLVLTIGLMLFKRLVCVYILQSLRVPTI
jgi:hypothetical protein